VPHQRLLGDGAQIRASIVVAVPVKYCSTNSLCSPTASKICAPQ
jgi:hypothetical protein